LLSRVSPEEVLSRIDQLLYVLRVITEDLGEVSRALKSISDKHIVEAPKRIEKIDKEQMFREIARWVFSYKISGLKEFTISLKDQKAIRLAELKEWNKLWDYLYEEKYSDLLLLYNKAQSRKKREEATLFEALYWEEEEKGLFEDLPHGYEEIEYPQDDQTIYDED